MIDSFDSVTALARGTAGNFDARLGSNLTSNPDPSLPIYAYVATSGASNFSGYWNTRLDYVLTNGLKATDTKARGVNYHVAQHIIAADRPIVVLYSAVIYAASSTSLIGVQLGATGLIRVDQARYRYIERGCSRKVSLLLVQVEPRVASAASAGTPRKSPPGHGPPHTCPDVQHVAGSAPRRHPAGRCLDGIRRGGRPPWLPRRDEGPPSGRLPLGRHGTHSSMHEPRQTGPRRK